MSNLTHNSYNNSDVWIDEIPEHWEIVKLKYSANVNASNVDKKTNENEIPVLLCNYVDVFKNDFIDSSFDFMKASATEREINKFILSMDDVLITKDSETPKEIAIPAYVKENIQNTICGYHLAHIKTNKTILLGCYLFRLFQAKSFNSYFETQANGITRFGLSLSSIKDAFILLPPLQEQKSIAEFLDYKTSQIDDLIEQKEKLLKLLEEKRIALITHAVTRGINPDVKMKHSGIDWIGDIPEQWDIKRLKFTVDLINEKVDYDEYDLSYIGLENIESWTGKRIETLEYEPEGTVNYFQKGDVLFGKLRPYLAKSYLAEDIGLCTTEALVLRCKSELIPEYLINYILTHFFIDVVNSSTYGAKMPRASWNFICSLPMLIPTKEEQIQIVEFLRRELILLDSLYSEVINAIEKLKEYRTSLISSAVTGKIDVRNFKTPEKGKK